MIVNKPFPPASNLSYLHLPNHRHILGASPHPRHWPRQDNLPCTTTTRPCRRQNSTNSRHRRFFSTKTIQMDFRMSKPLDNSPQQHSLPPYTLTFTENDQNSSESRREKCKAVSDREWELRTGRAIYVIQETLPTFFETGLITSVDKTTGAPKSTSPLNIIDSAASLEFLSTSASANGSTQPQSPSETRSGEVEDIYSPNVRLQYTPPIALPAPFPKTFRLEGFQLYVASSALVRHTMNTLYNNLEVTLTKVSVHTGPPPPGSPSSSDGLAYSSLSHSHVLAAKEGSSSLKRHSKKRVSRDKYLLVRQLVSGIARVSGQPGEWEVESVYMFSPLSGLVLNHTVNSIRPAPHIAVYDLMKTGLGQMFGFGGHHPVGGPAPAPSSCGIVGNGERHHASRRK